MKRPELLRQLDQEVESLKRQLGDVSKRLAQFTEEEIEQELLQHRLKLGEFAISIDDGFVEWKWVICPKEGPNLSIDKIVRRICSALKANYDPSAGVNRTELEEKEKLPQKVG